MLQTTGDLFNHPCDALCITTNGFVKSNGYCVMGKGCAKQLSTYDPNVPRTLGTLIRTNGNITQIIGEYGVPVLAFPVKPISDISNGHNAVKHMQPQFAVGARIPGWACKADLSIIIDSARALVALADTHGWKQVLLPRPGCGAGELSWNDVYPVLNQILDDRFISITFN